MAKIVFICRRHSRENESHSGRLNALSRRLSPDNIEPNPPLIIEEDGLSIGVMNPSSSLPVKHSSVCMGNLIRPEENWWKPLAEMPDGTYALFRGDAQTVEVASDMFASRTVWYVRTEDTFIASTSQRAILYFLRDFHPNTDAYAWMLSSGTLGPGLSWDSRIQYLRGGSRLVLNRKTWDLTVHEEKVEYLPLDLPEKEHESRLREAIELVFDNLGLDFARWALALSGGLDSRAILLFLKERKNLKCVTWGLPSSPADKLNDAYIARKLAAHFGCPHEYYEVAFSDEPFESIFRRFLITGEGRVDQITGYMDGFGIWKALFESGYRGILRGDVSFGNRPVSTPNDVYKNVGMDLLRDFDNLLCIPSFVEDLDQKRPARFERREDENLEKWRDRLNAEYEIAIQFAALNDMKLSFVEIVNPFLSRRIARRVRQLPDRLRTGKYLFKKIVDSINPRIPYAKHRALAFTHDVLKRPEIVRFIDDELGSEYVRSLLPETLLRFLKENMQASDGRISIKPPLLHRMLKPIMPKKLIQWRHNRMKKRDLDPNTLGFRACIISKTIKMLSEDARASS